MEIRPEYGILQQFQTKSYLEYMISTQLSFFDFNINSPVFMAGGHEKFHGREGFQKCPIRSPPAVICRRNQYCFCHIENLTEVVI